MWWSNVFITIFENNKNHLKNPVFASQVEPLQKSLPRKVEGEFR